jgi:hypothetical protein
MPKRKGARARLGLVGSHPSVGDSNGHADREWVALGNPTASPPRKILTVKARRKLGVVDYTLAKRALLRDFRRGLVSRLDICDAHPELIRAARYVGEQTHRRCPVCEQGGLRLLAYVYAEELKRDNGRVWAIDKAVTLAADCRNGACYIVEVCTGCSWNHLAEALVGQSAG